jgi:hypothetical protein
MLVSYIRDSRIANGTFVVLKCVTYGRSPENRGTVCVSVVTKSELLDGVEVSPQIRSHLKKTER